MIRFSIIIPIYKVEKYLNKCVNSVLKQTFNNMEIILVDDGSPDNCPKMCDEYLKKDNRIKVIHKENGGLSSARNAGIEIASGEYLIFLDSDDFWDDEYFLEVIDGRLCESSADVLVFMANKYYEDNDLKVPLINTNVERNKVVNTDKNEALLYLLSNNIYRAAAWNKVVKKSLVQSYKLRFKVGYLSEDMDWCGDILLHSKKFDIYENNVYQYRQQRTGSITAKGNMKLINDKLYMCEKGLNQINNLDNDYARSFIGSYYAYEFCVALGILDNVKDPLLIKKIHNCEELLKYDICKKVKMVNFVKRFLGLKQTIKILCLFVKLKNK